MDFYRIKERPGRNGVTEVYPDFKVTRSKDLMVQGKSFYAIWDEEAGLWSTDEYDVQRLVDADLMKYKDELGKKSEGIIQAKLLSDFSSNSWLQFRSYISHISDSSHQLDNDLTFSNTDVKKTDYVSKRLPYPLREGDISAWDELVGTLYEPEERAKIEWAIGAVVAGEAKHIQKFVVFYGAAGAGKSTILNIIQKLFEGYYTTFEAKALTSNSNAFSTEVFKSNPLVAIQHDGDLSKIEDNSKLNSIVSHEDMTMNEKYKPSYMSRINAFLFMGTNKPVKITDAKSGLIRRLIDIKPSGNRLTPRRYQTLISQIDFELGAIAHHCLQTYLDMGKDYYNDYRPVEMMLETDIFYNYIEDCYDVFREQDGVTLNQAYDMYKQFCESSLVDYKLPRHKFREELKNYFGNFEERAVVDGVRVRSWYSNFLTERFKVQSEPEKPFSLVLDHEESIFDEECRDQPAQYSNDYETPSKKWAQVKTSLKDLDTSKLHYVKLPENHIVIDFDLKDASGQKSAEKNLEAASRWPPTYAEFSKGGGGIHLHYIYDGDPSQLSRVYDEGIEIKVFTGDSSLRRRLSFCNNTAIAHISSGLPLKEKKVINVDTVKSEKALRELVERNLRKEIHPATKPSVDFIHKILEDAYSSGMSYDLTDMRPRILAFANNSSNQNLACLKIVQTMKFKSEESAEQQPEVILNPESDDAIVFFDVEVFPNLFVVCWKYAGEGQKVVRMINPTATQIEELMGMKLVGFNNRRYDNHILYARYMGYTNEQLYNLSKKIVTVGGQGMFFGEAYDLSYADIFDFSSKKQGLKKFQLELGIHHQENEHPWDEPVPDDKILEIADYCANDVTSTEAVFNDRYQDFVARRVLADISGLSVNSTTNSHTTRIIFGDNREPQDELIYTNLATGQKFQNGQEIGTDPVHFPGYVYDFGKSTYKGEEVGEGGYVYSEPGMYSNVALLDVASMHPASIENLELFGPYTKKFSDIKRARMAIKHGEYDTAKEMLNGALAPYLKSQDDAEALSYALKIAINSVYGLTAASFPNPFRDPNNKDNIVAKRGALFMVDLKEFVQSRGFTVAHIKTDSIKIPDATPEIIAEVMEFGQKYGYEFEHEATYERMALVNNAVYVARVAKGRKPAYWTAVGAQYQHPYVFKTLFSKEPIEFYDLAETKSVTTALYLDMDEGEEINDTPMVESEDHIRFIGRVGSFCPIKPGRGGGRLLREKNGEYHAATGSKGYRWLEAEMVKTLGKEEDIDMSYFEKLVDEAVDNLKKYGDVEWFIGDED